MHACTLQRPYNGPKEMSKQQKYVDFCHYDNWLVIIINAFLLSAGNIIVGHLLTQNMIFSSFSFEIYVECLTLPFSFSKFLLCGKRPFDGCSSNSSGGYASRKK